MRTYSQGDRTPAVAPPSPLHSPSTIPLPSTTLPLPTHLSPHSHQTAPRPLQLATATLNSTQPNQTTEVQPLLHQPTTHIRHTRTQVTRQSHLTSFFSPQSLPNTQTDIPVGNPYSNRVSHRPTPSCPATIHSQRSHPRHRKHFTQRKLTTCNLDNAPWGDLLNTKDPSHFRIYFQNINGISATDQYLAASEIGLCLSSLDIDAFGLAETNIDWKDIQARHTCQNHFRKFWPHLAIATSSSQTRLDSNYLPGGTLMSVTGSWLSRLSCKGEDPSGMGRWSYLTFRGKQNAKMTLITAYQVCSQSHPGPTTAFTQQWQALRDNGDKSPNPRRSFQQDFLAWVKMLLQNDHELLIMIDANSPAHTSSGIISALETAGLLNVHEALHGPVSVPTHQSGSCPIDFIMSTPLILSHTHRAGIEPFGATLHSDHRGLFVDICLTSILKASPHPIASPLQRGIRYKDKRVSRQYQEKLHEVLQSNNIFSKLRDALAAPSTVTPELLEQMDTTFTAGMLAAENSCRRQWKAPWSPMVCKARRTVSLWRLWVTELKTGRNLSEQRSKICLSHNLEGEFSPPSNLAAAFTSLKQARRQLRDILKHADEIRKQWLTQQASLADDLSDAARAKLLRNILQAEEKREFYRRLRRYFKPLSTHGLNHVLIPSEDTPTWQVVDDPSLLYHHLIQRNQRHFDQASGTPFTTAPLKDFLGPSATNECCTSLLEGDEASLNIPPNAARDLLQILQSGRLPPISTDISAQDMDAAFRKWRETTSTSPSGRHLGHYKAVLTKRSDSLDPEHPATQILQAHATMINLALQHNYPYTRWLTVVSAMIAKIPGTPRIDKLRTIHIVEADLNFLLGLLWQRRLQSQGEIHQAFHSEQWGSRKGTQAIDVAMLKRLTYNVSRLTRSPLGTFDNDAKACYDRVVMPVALLRSRHLGMPPSVCHLISLLAQNFKYHVKTAHGISETSYSSNEVFTHHGTGQGLKHSPTIWMTISTWCMQAMDKQTHPFTISNPQGTVQSSRRMDGYVDDTTIWTNRNRNETELDDGVHITLQQLQHAAQCWEQLLEATGGRLELSKCFYYILQWHITTSGRTKPKQSKDMVHLHPIHLIDSSSGQAMAIERREATQSHRTLGIMLNPDDCDKDEYHRLSQKAVQLGRALRTTPIRSNEALHTYNTFILPSLTYSLPACALSWHQLNQIQRAPIASLTHKLGLNKSFPRAVLHGPITFGGFGVPHLGACQGEMQVALLLRHLRSSSPLGKLLQITIDWTQLVAGVTWDILQYPARPLPHLEGNWLCSLRQFLTQSNANIPIQSYRVYPRRQGDAAIMESALSHGLYGKHLRLLNHWRLYLQVETLSDLTDHTGSFLLQNSDRLPSRPRGNWVESLRPAGSASTFWHYIRSIFNIPTNAHLPRPLGNWNHHYRKREWHQLIEVSDKELFTRVAANRWQCQKMSISRNSSGYARWVPHSGHGTVEISVCPPLTSLPITSFGRRQDQYQVSRARHIEVRSVERSITTFAQFVRLLPPWESRLLSNIDFLDRRILWQSLASNQHITLVSDGSQGSDRGAFGWVCAVADEIVCTGAGTVTGSEISSYRSEAYGCAAVLLFVSRYAKFLRVPLHARLTCACDNQALIKNLQKLVSGEATRHELNPLTPEYDILNTIRILLHELGHPVTFVHVKGHQDRAAKGPLPRLARLNVNADHIAYSHFTFHREFPKPTYLPFPAAGPVLYINDQPVFCNVRRHLREAASLRQLKLYYQEKFGWDEEEFQKIDWTAYYDSIKTTTKATLSFAIRAGCGWLPTNARLVVTNIQSDDACQSCGAPETVSHILACPSRAAWRTSFLQDLQDHLHEHHNTRDGKNIMQLFLGWAQNTSQGSCIPDTTIPWELCMTGKCPKGWISNRLSNPSAPRRLAKFLLLAFHNLWKQRCDHQHPTSGTNPHSFRRRELEAQLRVLYATAPKLLPIDQTMFHESLEQILLKPDRDLTVTRDFLHQHVQKSLKRASSQALLNTRDIRNYFQPISTEIRSQRPNQPHHSTQSQER